MIFLVRYHDFAGQAWAEGNGSLHRAATRGLRRGNGLYIWAMPLVMIYLGRIRVMNKQKKKKKKSPPSVSSASVICRNSDKIQGRYHRSTESSSD